MTDKTTLERWKREDPARYEAYRLKKNAKSREWSRDHKDHKAATAREWRAKNRTRSNETIYRWNKNNPEKWREIQRKCNSNPNTYWSVRYHQVKHGAAKRGLTMNLTKEHVRALE